MRAPELHSRTGVWAPHGPDLRERNEPSAPSFYGFYESLTFREFTCSTNCDNRVFPHAVGLLAKMSVTRRLDPDATLDNLRAAVMISEESERIALRELGDLHGLTADFGNESRAARAALAAVVHRAWHPVDALAIWNRSGRELATFFESRLAALATEDAEEAAD